MAAVKTYRGTESRCKWEGPDAKRFPEGALAGLTGRFYVRAYAPAPASPPVTRLEELRLPGRKVAGWHEFLRARPGLFKRYERIALINNDTACSARDISLPFRRGREHDLWLWQPTLGFAAKNADYRHVTAEMQSRFKIRLGSPIAYAGDLK